MTYLVKLRENVKWQNGADFSAEDVKFTIETIKSLGDLSIYNANVTDIENIEIINKTLVKIKLKQEKRFFEYNLTFPIISYSLYNGEDIKTSEKNNLPIGTGKYKVQTIDGVQIELKQNPEWWNTEKVKLRIGTITVRIYGNIAEVYNAYKLGGVDMVVTQSLNMEDNIGTIGSNVQKNYGRKFDYLSLNNKSNILSHKEVRKAISYGINKQEIVNTIYSGKYIVADHPLEYGSYLYNKNTNSSEYNIDKAKQMLIDGGWEHTNKNWQKKEGYSWVKLRLNLVVQSNNENRIKVAEIIKKNLEALDIPVTINKVSDNTFQNYLNNKNYDIILAEEIVRYKSRHDQILWRRKPSKP